MFLLTEIKYQLLRNKNRSLLTVCIAALLICCMSLYLGNIQTGEAALQNLAESIPVNVQVVSRDGSKSVGIEIDERHFEGIINADIRDPVYTASASALWVEEYRTEKPSHMDTSISAISSASALPGLSAETISFSDGWDLQFLNSADAVCVLSDYYAGLRGLEIGDVMTMPVYVPRYNDDNFTIRYEPLGEQTLTVIGTYQQSSLSGVNPVSMLVSIPWLRQAIQENDLAFIYDSFRCTLNNPLNLNEFKEAMQDSRYMKVIADSYDPRHGDALVVDDQLFIETAEKLEQNLKVLRWFMAPFFALVVLMITLVTFQILRSARRDMAIATSLGRPKPLSACVYFLSTLLANLLGCLIAFAVLLLITELTAVQILMILGLFLICSCAGIWIALLLLLRFDTLALLTKVD